MGDVIQRRLKRYMAGTVLCILLLFLIAVFLLWKYERNNIDCGMIRVMSNQIVSDLETENGIEKVKKTQYELPYCVLSLDGRVLLSSMKSYTQGEVIDLHVIGTIDNYMIPVQLNGDSTSLLYVESNDYQEHVAVRQFLVKLPWLLLVLFVIYGLLIRRYQIMKNDIWKPIHQIHQVTKDMLEGRLETSVTYDYEGEIGTLCRDFESLKEEVIDGMEREVKSKEKERALYASISHDLKTPLAIITGYLEELLLGVIKQEEIQETLERSLDKANVLNKLIQDILEHSKAQLNQLSIKKEEVYAKEYFSELLIGYEKDSNLQHYQLQYDLPENLMLLIDRNRIAQVMQNLFDNASKYRKQGQDLALHVKFEVINDPSKLLIISVKDNGKGIEAADQPFIFDMFYRGNKARTQNIPGSGLGLNISQYIVMQHGGHIECDSIAGVGTTMSFSVPII